MVKIEAPTLEEALIIAARELGCSVSELEYEVVVHPESFFFGLWRREAKIVAHRFLPETPTGQDLMAALEPTEEGLGALESTLPSPAARKPQISSAKPKPHPPKNLAVRHLHGPRGSHADLTLQEIAQKLEQEINELFAHLPFKLEKISVSPLDKTTLSIHFQGEDSALLIGKEGYRYKALSYLLFNWIHSVYGVTIRLEVAEFLRNQEESVSFYLRPVIEMVTKVGYGQTKPLDGILATIALKQLRAAFPEKHVVLGTSSEGEHYVIVSESRT